MAAAEPLPDTKGSKGSTTVTGLVIRLVIIALFDSFAVWFILNLLQDSAIILAIAVGVIVLFANVVVLRNDAFPIRWMLVGLILMTMFSIYPILFTINISLTNFGEGHLVTKEQSISQIERIKYLPEGAGEYTWTAYRSEDGQFAVWLDTPDSPALLALPNQELVVANPGEFGVGELDGDGIPETIDGYERLNRLTVVQYINQLGELDLGTGDQIAKIQSLDRAAELEQRYIYDEETDAFTDQVTGQVYTPVEGLYTAENGDVLRPGFRVYIGLQNFADFFASPAVTGPLIRIVIWNFVFAFFSVATTFFLGLAIALIFNDRTLPGRKIILTLLLIPYTIPSLITIMVWRGMLNPEFGVINEMMEAVIGWSPAWFTDPYWAKVAILMVNLWLGYPYFMLVCSGALQAIPTDIYGAAEVDGANMWQRFWRITFPLLLVAIGPLLVASFIFNFNNFNVIFLFIQGGPPIAGASTNAGHTDILISYVYNLAFAGGRGAQYGFAAAITMVVFVFVAIMTLLQFRYTQMWEEVSENV